ncbi:hypothetical protein, partial [Roseibium polysiphoniae]|uniref:hypothetical protein n=1 Tax=Roseibium polysiphoniae TaxID=2571221 RepID=UPI00329899E1
MDSFATEITRATLEDLIENRIVAIRISNFMTSIERDISLRMIRFHTRETNYLWSKDFSVIGTSIGEAHENSEKEAEYFAEASATNRLFQEGVF